MKERAREKSRGSGSERKVKMKKVAAAAAAEYFPNGYPKVNIFCMYIFLKPYKRRYEQKSIFKT
jgi:hypothetical protein